MQIREMADDERRSRRQEVAKAFRSAIANLTALGQDASTKPDPNEVIEIFRTIRQLTKWADALEAGQGPLLLWGNDD